jgi:hypothetical protein
MTDTARPAKRAAVAADGLRDRLVRMRRELIRRVILCFTDAAKEPVDFEEAAFRDCYVKSLYEGALLARPILMRTAFERPHLLASSQPPEARRPL